MSENLAFPTVFACEADRRYWLLSKALEVVPLDRAIELARAAEAFITQASSSTSAHLRRTSSAVPTAQAPPGMRAEDGNVPLTMTAAQAPQDTPLEQGEADVHSTAVESAFGFRSKADGRPRLPLSREQREVVLSRMAQGAKNAELASEFGLSPRQVQGIRMGSAREIARRREQPVRPKAESIPKNESIPTSESLPKPEGISPGEARIDDVVRYLRQQDDVVVPEHDGTFLVNARFRMPMSELVARANRIRLRQGKPEFNVADSAPSADAKAVSTNGHPVSWAENRAKAVRLEGV